MNVTHKKVHTIYQVLYKIKQLKNKFKKLTLKLSTTPLLYASYTCGSRNMCGKLQLLRWWVDIVCLLLWQTVYSIYCIRYFNVLVSVIMEYTISYRDERNAVNSSWHTVCSALLPKLLTAANAALWTFIHHGYVFIR